MRKVVRRLTPPAARAAVSVLAATVVLSLGVTTADAGASRVALAAASPGDTTAGGGPAHLTQAKHGDNAYLIAGGWSTALKAAGYEQREYLVVGDGVLLPSQRTRERLWIVECRAVDECAVSHTDRGAHADRPGAVQRDGGRGVAERQRGWRRCRRFGLSVSGAGASGLCLGRDLGAAGRVDNLRQKDPARYESLSDPGDQFSYDIFTQAARALVTGAL